MSNPPNRTTAGNPGVEVRPFADANPHRDGPSGALLHKRSLSHTDARSLSERPSGALHRRTASQLPAEVVTMRFEDGMESCDLPPMTKTQSVAHGIPKFGRASTPPPSPASRTSMKSFDISVQTEVVMEDTANRTIEDVARDVLSVSISSLPPTRQPSPAA